MLLPDCTVLENVCQRSLVILRDFKKYTVCARHRVLVVESLSKSKPTVDQLRFVTLIEAGLDCLI